MSHNHWNLLPPVTERHFVNTAGLPPLIAQLLYNRGLTEPSQWELFIAADKRLSGDPFLLPDIHQAIARIYRALLSGENIAIYGDFDVDGITATALLVQGLSVLGGKVVPYIPHRLTEGYGLKIAALENLYRQGISLVITVDCGITAIAEVNKAKKMGLDIIVTDHHIVPDEIPPALAVIDPKQPGSSFPFSELAGVGVAFKLLQALFQGMGKEELLDGLIDLVALGTIADMVPLLGENRYLAKEGLRLLNTTPRLGVMEIAAQSGLNVGSLNSESISWVIAPRLNAAGRLEHAMTGYKLLMTDSPQEAQSISLWLEKKNAERQQLTTSVLAKAREQVRSRGKLPLLIASDCDYPAGIMGLVAGKLSEEFYRPAILIRTGGQTSSGSCRSIPEFDITLALNRCSHLLSQFGGHSRAAGFIIPTRNLARFEQELLDLAALELDGIELLPRLDIEMEAPLSELGGDTFAMIQQLAPFGQGNPAPVFLSRGVKVVDCQNMGNGREHLRLKLKQGDAVWDAVGFRLGNHLADIVSSLDIVYNLEIDHWGGVERLRLNLLDFAPGGKIRIDNVAGAK